MRFDDARGEVLGLRAGAGVATTAFGVPLLVALDGGGTDGLLFEYRPGAVDKETWLSSASWPVAKVRVRREREDRSPNMDNSI